MQVSHFNITANATVWQEKKYLWYKLHLEDPCGYKDSSFYFTAPQKTHFLLEQAWLCEMGTPWCTDSCQSQLKDFLRFIDGYLNRIYKKVINASYSIIEHTV